MADLKPEHRDAPLPINKYCVKLGSAGARGDRDAITKPVEFDRAQVCDLLRVVYIRLRFLDLDSIIAHPQNASAGYDITAELCGCPCNRPAILGDSDCDHPEWCLIADSEFAAREKEKTAVDLLQKYLGAKDVDLHFPAPLPFYRQSPTAPESPVLGSLSS